MNDSRHEDLDLAAACVRGDERAWRELSAAHFGFLRTFARRFLPEPAARELADEVIADLYTRGKLQQYEGRSSLRTWLAAVVARAALNSRQALGRWVPLEQAPEDDADAAGSARIQPEDDEAAALITGMLSEAVGALPAEDRLLLRLYYEQEMTLDAIGAALGLSGAAISRRLKHLREGLRMTMDAHSRRDTGEPVDALRAGVDFARLDVDLGKLLGADLSKQRHAKET